MNDVEQIRTIEHAGELEDVETMPAYLMPCHDYGHPRSGRYSCCFCGVGDNGVLLPKPGTSPAAAPESLKLGEGVFKVELRGEAQKLAAVLHADSRLEVTTKVPLTPPGGMLKGEFEISGIAKPLTVREIDSERAPDGTLRSQSFIVYTRTVRVSESVMKYTVPTTGCVKLKLSLMRQRPIFPVHVTPSLLDRDLGCRQPISYEEGISRFADLLLSHRGPDSRILIYACGQIDYFTIFAMQEVFRLLGVRNLTGNAEHCLNAGAVHNEILTGQESPFLTIDQSVNGPQRFYLFNGWNGLITHPPVFGAIAKREDLDAYLVEVAVTESAHKLGPERILLIRPRTDPHLALAVAHEILTHHAHALEQRFIDNFADRGTFEQYVAMAESAQFAPQTVAERIAPEPLYVERLVQGIEDMARKLAKPEVVPINIPSVGLSQTSGVVAHCLWGNLLAMLGKFGLNADGTAAGGTLRLPGQINAESEVQGCRANISWAAYPSNSGPRRHGAWGCRMTPTIWCWRTPRGRRLTTLTPRRGCASSLSALAPNLKPT